MAVKRKLWMAMLLTFLGFADNVFTWLSVNANSKVEELNPIVKPFLTNQNAFAFFTVLKCGFMFLVAYSMEYKKRVDYIIYVLVALVFCQAIITAALNYLFR